MRPEFLLCLLSKMASVLTCPTCAPRRRRGAASKDAAVEHNRPARQRRRQGAKRRAKRQANQQPQQMSLSERGNRGGYRAGAGRPKGSRTSSRIPHRSRPAISARNAVHVTVEVVPLRRSLRSKRASAAIMAIFAAEKDRKGFRLVGYSIRRNHIHLVCESDDASCLARGMQRLCSRIARRVNRLWGRWGTFFADRYHSRVISGPRDMRNVLRYVLLNDNKDELIDTLSRGGRFTIGGFDPLSSARWFDGWDPADARPPPPATGDQQRWPVTRPRSWLATKGWRKHGLLRATEIPAAWEREAKRRSRQPSR